EDYDEWLAGNTWVFESQEFRTGVFKWTADEFGTYEATAGITPSTPNHYLPGDSARFHAAYSAFSAGSTEDAIRYARDRQAELASVAVACGAVGPAEGARRGAPPHGSPDWRWSPAWPAPRRRPPGPPSR